MKSLLIGVLGLTIVGALWAKEPQQPTIAVNGSATLTATPDRMAWQVQVSVEGDEAPSVLKSQNDAASAAVLELLEEYAIDPDTVQSSGPLFRRSWNKGQPAGYTCYNNIHFVLSQFELYPELIEALIVIPDVVISNTSFFYSRHEEVVKEAHLKALEDARAKATRMLAVYDLELGPVLRITEGGSPIAFHDASVRQSVASFAEGSQIREGLLKITGTVSVQFAIAGDEEPSVPLEAVPACAGQPE